jgi:hypothetical protein
VVELYVQSVYVAPSTSTRIGFFKLPTSIIIVPELLKLSSRLIKFHPALITGVSALTTNAAILFSPLCPFKSEGFMHKKVIPKTKC